MFEFFEKIVCINLDERTDRWKSAAKEFTRAGVEDRVIRFPGIKNELGHLGCRESHLQVIQCAQDQKLNNILILEDDIVFSDDCIEVMQRAISEIEQLGEWHILYLGANIDPKVGKLDRVTPTLARTNYALATHAYVLNRYVFLDVLQEANNFDTYDVFLNQKIVSRGSSYIVNPMVCIQKPGYSDVLNKPVDYGWMIKYFDLALDHSADS